MDLGVIILAVQWEIRRADLDWNNRRNIHIWVEVGGPFVEVQSSCVHEVRAILENQVLILLELEKESVKPLATKVV